MRFDQTEFTGCAVVGAITPLGHDGPKHYGIVLGKSEVDGKIYIAEKNVNGNQLVSWDDFTNKYKDKGDIKIEIDSDKNHKPLAVAQRALDDVIKHPNDSYCLLTNNCEHFANQVRYGKKVSVQVSTVLGILVVVGVGVLIWQAAKQKA